MMYVCIVNMKGRPCNVLGCKHDIWNVAINYKVTGRFDNIQIRHHQISVKLNSASMRFSIIKYVGNCENN